jgi:PKD repeat protein
MKILPFPNRLLLALAVWGLATTGALLPGTAAAQGDFDFGTLTVVTPEVVIGEAARVEVELPPGSDFDLIVAWGDGATDRVDRFGALLQTFDHAYASAGAKLVTLTVDDVDATFVDAATIDVAAPSLTLAGSAAIGETIAATITGGPVGGTLDWGDGTRTEVAAGDSQPEHAYTAAGTYVVQLEDAPGNALAFATVTVDAPRLTVSPASALVGEAVTATVAGAPAGAALDWGDGTRTPLATGDDDVEHAYAAAGTYVVQLEDAVGAVLDAAVVLVQASATSSLTLSTTQALLAEVVTATVGDAPSGATLDWGDGRRVPLAGGSSVIDHAYTSVGAFVVRLLDGDGAVLDLATVGVVRGVLRVDLPSRADVGAPAEVEIEGLASNAPSGARLAWGDGSADVVTGDGVVRHAYARAGSYLIRLTDLADGGPLAVGLVVVDAAGTLSLDGPARLLAPTTWIADGLAPGLTYEIALGDGAVVDARADASGALRVEHRYLAPVASVDASLTLIDGGQRLLLDTVRATLELPLASETMTLRAIPRVADGRIDVEIEAGGLLPGLPYVVGSPSLGWQAIQGDAGGAGSATFATIGDLDGSVEVVLAVRLAIPQGGVDERERARASTSITWPRGSETLAVDAAQTPILVSDTVQIRASGLVPGYAYELVVAGDTERPYRLTPATDGEWSIELPMAFFGPRFDVELVARYPTLGQFGPGETRAAVTLEPLTPTGSLELAASPVPFAVPTPLWVRDLTPGVPYRVEIGGEVVARFVGPAEGAVDLQPALRSTAAIDLRVDRAFADLVPVASISPGGVTFAGSLGFSYDLQRYLDTGEVTLQVRGAAAEHPHVVVFGDGRRIEGTTDAAGDLDLDVVDPSGDAFLRIQGFDREYDVARTRFDALPPRVLRFHGGTWRVRVTQLDAPFEAPGWTLSGRGVVEDFVIGGRLQDPVPMTFSSLRVFAGGTVRSGFAELAGPWAAQLPQAVRGAELTLTRLTLQLSGQPAVNGSVALPTGERSDFDRVMFGTARPESGFMVSVLARGDGRPLAGGAWNYQSNGFAVLDLSTESNYNLRRPDGRFVLDHAYDGWTEVGRASPARRRAGAGSA